MTVRDGRIVNGQVALFLVEREKQPLWCKQLR
ncbi:MAG: hypothetical protein JWL62_2926 [Hyphomicrobiales bacterium]|nr:hypothetical protein [Hyphomicrobiales bacterium]